jgi:transposase
MYIDDQIYTTKYGKTHRRVLLRQNYRKDGRILKKTFANLSDQPEEEIEAIKIALSMKNNLPDLKQLSEGEFETHKKVGSVAALYQVIEKLGIAKILGRSREALLIIWLIIARLIEQGSRLSAVRLAQEHAACEIIGLDKFDEDDLYSALGWLNEKQEEIERKLFAQKTKQDNNVVSSGIFLYDLTSSYLEGEQNELADWGYNRDGKKGKLQIVYGLLTCADGDPVAIEAFTGNTNDNKTVKNQVDKLKNRFSCEHVTFVGDKGTIKCGQIDELHEFGFNYITSITKEQIRTLMNIDLIQLGLFDSIVCEVNDDKSGVRYILRRNPERALKVRETRDSKIESIKLHIEKANIYLTEHSRSKIETQINNITEKIKKLKMEKIVSIDKQQDEKNESTEILILTINQDSLDEIEKLDGCYVIKTDLPSESVTAETIHDRYKDLSKVEWAFRTQKTDLEVRPIFVRKEERTRAHLFIAMIAYKIERYLRNAWKLLDLTVQEGINRLATITSISVTIGKTQILRVVPPGKNCKALLNLIEAKIPSVLPYPEVNVTTKISLSKT